MPPRGKCRLDVDSACTGTGTSYSVSWHCTLYRDWLSVFFINVDKKQLPCGQAKDGRSAHWPHVMPSGTARQRIRLFWGLVHRVGYLIAFQNAFHWNRPPAADRGSDNSRIPGLILKQNTPRESRQCGGFSPANTRDNRPQNISKNRRDPELAGTLCRAYACACVNVRGRPGREFSKIACLEACEAEKVGKSRGWACSDEKKQLQGAVVSEFESEVLAARDRIIIWPARVQN